MRYFLIFIFAYLHMARGQVPFPGTCPEVKIIETFDLDKYMGTWYEYSKYPVMFEAGRKCQQAVYKKINDTDISVVNSGVIVILNKPSSTKGTAKVIAPGQLAVSFGKHIAETANYLVLDTDYDNYAVVYSCKNTSLLFHTKLLWILTRQRQPLKEHIDLAEKVIKENNLVETFLITSTQTDCPNIPEASTDDDQDAAASYSTIAVDNSSIDFASTSTQRVIDTA